MRFLWFAVLVLVGFLLIDAGCRQLLTGRARFDFEAGKRHDTLFVYFPGILADGVTSSTGLVPTWKQHGDVLLVSYDGRRFNGPAIARASAGAIESYVDKYDYQQVVFIGASMGGLVSYDTFRRLDGSLDVKFEMVLMDAPTGRNDFQSPLDKIAPLAWLWWAGPISNPLSRLYFNLTFVEPDDANIEPGVDRKALAESVDRAKSYKLSWSMDQTRYMLGHGKLLPGSLWGIPVIYVRSTRDNDTVRPEAYNAWNVAACGDAVRLEVDSTHVGFAERPETWRAAFEDQIIPALDLPD